MFCKVEKLLRFLSVVPTSLTTAEHYFSMFRRLKTYLKINMRQEYVSNICTFHAYQDGLDRMDGKTLLKEFVSRKEELS